jgi:hypothetical protein
MYVYVLYQVHIACTTCRYKKKNTGADISLNCFRTMSAMCSLSTSAMYAALTNVVELGSCAPGTYATRQWMFLPVDTKFMRLGRALEHFSRHKLREGEMTPVLR